MRERKPVIGVTCNFDYRDAVGMVSGMAGTLSAVIMCISWRKPVRFLC